MCRYILGDQQVNLQMEKLETFILDHLSMCKKNKRHITYLEKKMIVFSHFLAFEIPQVTPIVNHNCPMGLQGSNLSTVLASN